MYYVLYRCLYREHWYDDLPPFYDLNAAILTADNIALQRRTSARIYTSDGELIYEAAVYSCLS